MLDFTVALTLRARGDRDEEPGVAVTIGRRRIELRRHHSGDGLLWNRLERGGLYRRSLLPIGPIEIGVLPAQPHLRRGCRCAPSVH